MTTLWFCVPAHGRLEKAAICLRQLRRTCDSLKQNGIDASAVVIADDANLEIARSLAFATVKRDNQFVSRKFNDGVQLAMDEDYNPRPAEFVVPMGSDNFLDYRILLNVLPEPDEIVGFPNISFVRGDGLELHKTFLNCTGGCGMRIYPRALMEKVGFRPADEDRYRGRDTSILVNVRAASDARVMHVQTDPRQIVDWKTPGSQLNEYEQVIARHGRRSDASQDPFRDLSGFFPAESLEEMQAHYGLVPA